MVSRAPETRPEFRQEEERLDRAGLLLTLAGLGVLLFILAAAAVFLLQLFSHGKSDAASVEAAPVQAEAVNALHSGLFRESAAGEVLKQQQRAALERYGWVDRNRGVARLPIDVALDVVAKEAP